MYPGCNELAPCEKLKLCVTSQRAILGDLLYFLTINEKFYKVSFFPFPAPHKFLREKPWGRGYETSSCERMLISKSRYLSLFNVFFFSTKYFIIFGKVADQGHRGLARTKDHICTTNTTRSLNNICTVAIQGQTLSR